MTIKQWRYDDDDDETAAGHLLNTILGKVLVYNVYMHTVQAPLSVYLHMYSVTCCHVAAVYLYCLVLPLSCYCTKSI